VLTGEAPTENENLLQGLNQLQHKRPAEPRSFDPNLPLDLQLICLKCLVKSPRDRYDSMWELAADFRRFHSGQRVLARPPATWTQFYRWVQANKLVASLSMGLLLAVVLGLSVTLFLWRQAEARRAQANGLLRSANAILSKGNKLAEDSLDQTAGSFSYRYDRLHQSVGFLQQIAEEFPSDFDLQRELATTHFRLAKVSGRRGFYDEGIENFVFAETLFRQLSELQPEDVSLRFDVFHSLLGNHHLCEASRLEGYQHEKLFAAQAVIEEVLAADAIYAVFHKDKPINLRTLNSLVSYPGPKYKKVSFSNPGHAFNLADRLNKLFKVEDFSVVELKQGRRINEAGTSYKDN
jgi:tetratricopeptide (TPR) repeat protein